MLLNLMLLENWSLFSRLASLISGFLKATQLFRPNPLSSLHIVRVEMLLLSLSSSREFCCFYFLRYDFTKRSSAHDHSRFFQVFSIRWTVFNPVLAVSAISLDVFFYRCMPIIWPFWNRLTSFPIPEDVSSSKVVQEMRSYSLHQLGLNNLLPAET